MAGEEKYRTPVTYDGIGPFPLTQFDEQGFLMEWSDYRFPHRRYKDAEPMAVAPLTMNGSSPFYNGIEGYEDLWPQRFMQMRRRCQLPRGGYLRHMLYGNVWGHFTRWDPQYNATKLNGCDVAWTFSQDIDPGATQLDIVERNPMAGAKNSAAIVDAAVKQLAQPAPARKELFNTGSTAADVIVTITQVDALIATASPPAPITFPVIPSPQIVKIAQRVPFQELVDTFDRFLSDQRNNYDEIAAEAEKVDARFQELEDAPEMLLAENADLFVANQSARAEVAKAAIEAQEKAARMVTFDNNVKRTALEMAMYLYEDPFRADEILRYNAIDGTEYPVGMEIRFLDR